MTSEKARIFTDREPFRIFDEIDFLPNFPFPRGLSFRALNFFFQLPRVFAASSAYLSKINPDICVGFGSYVSYPGIRLAKTKKIPTLIHEQNCIPGKATLWLAHHADCVAVTFPQTLAEFKLHGREVVGLPFRASLLAAALKSGQNSIDGRLDRKSTRLNSSH